MSLALDPERRRLPTTLACLQAHEARQVMKVVGQLVEHGRPASVVGTDEERSHYGSVARTISETRAMSAAAYRMSQ